VLVKLKHCVKTATVGDGVGCGGGVGVRVGEYVGGVGSGVGNGVGCSVGERVGESVGDGVGGTYVAHICMHCANVYRMSVELDMEIHSFFT